MQFRTRVDVGRDVTADDLQAIFDAVVLATGATRPRDLNVLGRSLAGIHFAVDCLTRQNRVVAGDLPEPPSTAQGKRVIVIGGGDTGRDCIGTAIRQGAVSVLTFELLRGLPRTDPAPTVAVLSYAAANEYVSRGRGRTVVCCDHERVHRLSRASRSGSHHGRTGEATETRGAVSLVGRGARVRAAVASRIL